MRKLNFFQYNCPVCAADLIQEAVDFSYSADNGEQTKTTIKCLGCQERFFYLEKASIATDEKTAPLYCRFCKQKCYSLALNNDYTDYYKCLSCKVSYEYRYDPGHNDIYTINMYTVINKQLYVMRQYMRDNWTQIEILPDNPDDTVILAQKFDFLMPNITPTNINQKLLTYLIFS